jgi:hypothetical protein
MSQPNPFSRANAPQHNLVSKIVTGIDSSYEVVVDLVDIDNAFMRQVGSNAYPVTLGYITQIGDEFHPSSQIYVNQLGSTGTPVTQEYVTQIGAPGSSGRAYFSDLFVTRINGSSYPPPGSGGTGSGGVGPVGPTGPTGAVGGSGPVGPVGPVGPAGPAGAVGATGANAYLVGGTGVAISYSGQTGTITNTGVVGIASGFGISVTPVAGQYQQFQVSYTGGTTGSGPPGPTGPAGPGLQGPAGQLLYYGQTGVASSSKLTYDGTAVYTPAVQVSSNTNSLMYLESSGITSTIYSGAPNSGNILRISDLRNYATSRTIVPPPTMSIDTFNGTVGIGNRGSTYSLDVSGNTRISFNGTTSVSQVAGGTGTTGIYRLAAGATYKILGWGGGGAGNGGTGGAGGYSEVSFNTGLTGMTLRWDQLYGGTGGGGNALVCWLDSGPTFLYVPGGGAGITGGFGAAAGETAGRSQPEGGVSSSVTGVTAQATYTDNNYWTYTTASNTTLINPTFSNAYISSSTAAGNATVVFSPPQVYNQFLDSGPSGNTFTFYVSAGTTYTINSSGMTFRNSTIQTPQNSLVITVNQLFNNVGDGIGNTYGGTTYTISQGTASYTSIPGNPTISGGAFLQNGPTGLSVSGGDVYWTGTYTGLLTQGFTFIVLAEPFGDIGFVGSTLTVQAGSTFFFPPFAGPTGLPSDISGTITTTGSVTGASGSKINVNQRVFTVTGITATGPNAFNLGGGGYTGGGEPASIRSIPVTGAVGYTLGNMPAGGGAGSWFFNTSGLTAVGFSGFTRIDYGGIGTYPYTSPYGQYGSGSTGSSRNSGYLILQQVNTLLTPNPALTVFGNVSVTGTVTANDIIATSDIRTKENIITIDSALSKVLGMHGVYFTRKNEGERRVGVIAQEVEEVLPEVVYTGEDGMKSVSYGSIVGLLIEAIKEQNEQIKKLM